MNSRMPRIRMLLLNWFMAVFLPAIAIAASAQQVLELKPNLQAFPAGNLAIVQDLSGARQLLFSATTWNNGDGPLVLVAGETDSATMRQKVDQRVFLSDGTFYDRNVGIFEWHPLHNHFHFEDYALYTLQPFDASGGSERTSAKTSFCIMDTTQVDTRLPGAPNKPVYVICGNAMQGMSVGWGDTYGSHLAGQSIDLTGLPDGDYKLIIEADPKKRLLEINDSDNTSCVLLRITNLTLNVLDSAGCSGTGSTVVVSSITPNTAPQGSLIPVTITGSGFAAGMGVSFENGSGARPVASNVTVVDSTTITATVTVKSGGGPRSDRVWDVRVGSGVLANGFAVQP
jgi:Lysyl oxidase